MKFAITLCFLISASFAIPILSPDDQKLNSIVISEIDFTTEHPLIIDNEPEKSFHELIEKYDEMYEPQNVRKRNSDENVENVEEGGKSLIEKIQIEDPDVKKEFEIEISNAMQQSHQDSTEPAETSEYDPNYSKKIPENSTKLTTHEKENIQVHLVEQLVHHNDHTHEYTTILPDEVFTHHELVINPEIVEVLEHINYESESELKAHEHTTVINVVDMDIDPIEIIPKDRHRESRVESTTDNNDKFAGFAGIPLEDLEEPGHEVTEPDHFFSKPPKEEESPTVEEIVDAEEEILRETLEFVAIYGKSLKFNDTPTTTESIDVTTSALIVDAKSSSEEDDDEGKKSISSKSSEEEEGEKLRKIDKSDESSEEVNADSQHVNLLSDEVFKESTAHEVKKKDHPDELAVMEGRQNVISDFIDAKTQATVTAIYDAFEDIVTTMADGIKLSDELRQNLNTFRGDSEEGSGVLDTLREAISSKNSKTTFLISDDMTVAENRIHSNIEGDAQVSMMAIISLIALISMIMLIGLFMMLKRRTERIYFV